jgi:hypothetical protein
VKRILLVLTVALVMAAMVALSVSPAFAAPGHSITNPQGKDNPYASGYSDAQDTYVYVYQAPPAQGGAAPGSGAAGGNPGYVDQIDGCHGPGC